MVETAGQSEPGVRARLALGSAKGELRVIERRLAYEARYIQGKGILVENVIAGRSDQPLNGLGELQDVGTSFERGLALRYEKQQEIDRLQWIIDG